MEGGKGEERADIERQKRGSAVIGLGSVMLQLLSTLDVPLLKIYSWCTKYSWGTQGWVWVPLMCHQRQVHRKYECVHDLCVAQSLICSILQRSCACLTVYVSLGTFGR